MKKCFSWFHKWSSDEFGKLSWAYRKCTKCGVVQGHTYDSQGGYWHGLSKESLTILQNELKLKKLKKL